MDSRRRTFAKAILWNIIGLSVMSAVGFVATGSFALGGMMALANAGIGFASYVLYERVWANVSWGRV